MRAVRRLPVRLLRKHAIKRAQQRKIAARQQRKQQRHAQCDVVQQRPQPAHLRQADSAALADTTRRHADTLRVRKAGIDAPVQYAAKDSLVYDAHSGLAYLYGDASVKYQNMGLQADFITLNMDSSLVRATGGLADTVTDTNAETLENGSATGFVFHQATSDALIQSIGRMLENWHNAKQWAGIRHNAMQADFGWHRAAEAYNALYQNL